MMSKRNFPRAASVRLDFLFHFLIKQKVKGKLWNKNEKHNLNE